MSSLCTRAKLHYLHVGMYRISYTRWSPGNFSWLHQRVVTCPQMRQSLSLPQCSADAPSLCCQHALSLCPAKHATSRHVQLRKQPTLCTFQQAFSSLLFFFTAALSSNSKTYLFCFLLSSCSSLKCVNSKEIFKNTSLVFLLSCKNWPIKTYAFPDIFQKHT